MGSKIQSGHYDSAIYSMPLQHSCGHYERQIYYPLWTSATDLSLWSLWTEEDTQEM